ncbi:tail fiber assembly protein [Enterobacter sp. PTB]|uniref:tail fiber assembly protein n=1 Tax=Enterobacter sp. PTB TaxID=3143437 RepID=UPI003DA9A339
MTVYFSATETGFYNDLYKADYMDAGTWPDDAVEISDIEYQSLLSGQENGYEITPDASGKPVLTDPVVDPVVVAEGTKRQLLAEADKIITPLERAVKHSMVTEEEKLRLAAWEKYSVLVSRVNPEDAPDIDWPLKPL